MADVSIVDPGAPGRPTFVGRDHDRRGALTLTAGKPFATFAAFLADDEGPYRGWVVACDLDDLSKQSFFAVTSPRQRRWDMGPGGASVGDDRSYVVADTLRTPTPTSAARARCWARPHDDQRRGDAGVARDRGRRRHLLVDELQDTEWTPRRLAFGAASAWDPALTASKGQALMTWQGSASDDALYWSTFDGWYEWTRPRRLLNGGSATGVRRQRARAPAIPALTRPRPRAWT